MMGVAALCLALLLPAALIAVAEGIYEVTQSLGWAEPVSGLAAGLGALFCTVCLAVAVLDHLEMME